jgi:hypothetical protein
VDVVTEQPKRRFGQVHLSTALVGTLIAGILLGLNLRPPRVIAGTTRGVPESANNPAWVFYKYAASGWPWVAKKSGRQYPKVYPAFSTAEEWHQWAQNDLAKEIQRGRYRQFDAGRFVTWGYVLTNFFACSALTPGSCVLFEYIIRRRAKP